MINYGFWADLPRPFNILAPMADVTDNVFRSVISDIKPADVMYTEFVSADGLMHPVGRTKLMTDLKFKDNQRPMVAQIFGSNSDNIEGAARLCKELGFDGVDINMGCPVKVINKQGAGSELIKTPQLAQDIVRAAMRGADPLPVSVKSRIGYNRLDEFEDWYTNLLETEPACIIMHLRTKKEMSKVPAHWDMASRLAEMRDAKGVGTLVAANGDVKDLDDAAQKAREHNLDGIMLGRAIFGNPWLFSDRNKDTIDWPERFKVILKHTKLYQETYVDTKTKSFNLMRKFYGAYVQGHPNAKQLREELQQSKSYSDVEAILAKY